MIKNSLSDGFSARFAGFPAALSTWSSAEGSDLLAQVVHYDAVAQHNYLLRRAKTNSASLPRHKEALLECLEDKKGFLCSCCLAFSMNRANT